MKAHRWYTCDVCGEQRETQSQERLPTRMTCKPCFRRAVSESLADRLEVEDHLAGEMCSSLTRK